MTKVDLQPLALTQTADGRQAVQCSQLYNALGLNPDNYTRWIRKNILNNVFAEIGTDYLPLSPLKDGIRNKNTTLTQPNEEIRNSTPQLFTQNEEIRTNRNTLTRPNGEIRQTLRQKRNRSRSMDFILTLDFAKKLAMMTRTAQGESVRRYFLHCEKIAKQKTELIQTELFAELEAYRSLEAIRLQRRELNRQARKHRERIKQAQATIKQLKYIQLTLNFDKYAN
jgi:hypothetical protein